MPDEIAAEPEEPQIESEPTPEPDAEVETGAATETGAGAEGLGEETAADPRDLAYVIESVVFAAGNPMSVKDLAAILAPPGGDPPPAKDVRAAANLLLDEYAPGKRGIVFHEVAGGYQFRTARENADYVRQVFKEKPARLGRAALETLAIIAYKQPATKADIESVRGVDADGAINTLLAKRLIKIAGRKEAIGRPLLYATTPEFLEAFGLKDLRDLPALDEIAPPVLEEEEDARQAEDDEETGTTGDGGPDDGTRMAAAESVVEEGGEEGGEEGDLEGGQEVRATAERGDDVPGAENDETLGDAEEGEGPRRLPPRGAQQAAFDEEGDDVAAADDEVEPHEPHDAGDAGFAIEDDAATDDDPDADDRH